MISPGGRYRRNVNNEHAVAALQSISTVAPVAYTEHGHVDAPPLPAMSSSPNIVELASLPLERLADMVRAKFCGPTQEISVEDHDECEIVSVLPAPSSMPVDLTDGDDELYDGTPWESRGYGADSYQDEVLFTDNGAISKEPIMSSYPDVHALIAQLVNHPPAQVALLLASEERLDLSETLPIAAGGLAGDDAVAAGEFVLGDDSAGAGDHVLGGKHHVGDGAVGASVPGGDHGDAAGACAGDHGGAAGAGGPVLPDHEHHGHDAGAGDDVLGGDAAVAGDYVLGDDSAGAVGHVLGGHGYDAGAGASGELEQLLEADDEAPLLSPPPKKAKTSHSPGPIPGGPCAKCASREVIDFAGFPEGQPTMAQKLWISGLPKQLWPNVLSVERLKPKKLGKTCYSLRASCGSRIDVVFRETHIRLEISCRGRSNFEGLETRNFRMAEDESPESFYERISAAICPCGIKCFCCAD